MLFREDIDLAFCDMEDEASRLYSLPEPEQIECALHIVRNAANVQSKLLTLFKDVDDNLYMNALRTFTKANEVLKPKFTRYANTLSDYMTILERRQSTAL